MGPDSIFLIGAILAVIAMLYSSVGHGGASGYIAVLTLSGLAPEIVRPVALSLNVVVAGLASYRFAKRGFIDWGSAIPILIASVPMAFIGGGIVLPDELYRPLHGTLLAFAATYLIWQTKRSSAAFSAATRGISRFGGMASGAGIGFVSGLSGIGGGVLLSPFFLITGWAGARQTAGIAAVFILANPLAGLAGNYVALKTLPSQMFPWMGRPGS
ncbi:Sulfite exporter TauE/SafE [Roseovarius gaetbuli]|uniref:Probable membrane transporter protein n=1 Tax=Roseovarius gaetbuli TaxID=1356575 RepID=A0A1X7AB74_9RHOB|nr:sulfite exporter TauE/SafE family protein [Roseovarius gaetbuli]SLN74573.1 Sulfite exporter TauE/SafE [Roseovarius gaetbuli]